MMSQPASEMAPNDVLDSALRAFDRARGPEEYRAMQERVCSLGPEVIPGVVAALSQPQGPDRFDLLLTLLLRWVRLDHVLALANGAGASWCLRASLAEALRYYAERLHPSEVGQRDRIAKTLASLARDPHDGVRVTAVEAAVLAQLAKHAELLPVLEDLAANDPNEDVREEARQGLAPID